MKTWKFLLASLLASSTIALTACNKPAENTQTNAEQATQDQNASDPVDAREDIMHEWKDAMGIMGGMIKNPDKFNLESFQTEAKFLAENAEKPWQYFADKEAGMGESKEDIWSNPEGFQAEIDKYIKATAQLNTVAQSATDVAGVQEAFGAVGASCKSCHTNFQIEH